MSGPVRMALAAMLPLAACGSGPADDPAALVADSTLVRVLADVHLADARAALSPDSARRVPLADSLRRVALASHGMDHAALDDRLGRLAQSPAEAAATYNALAQRLATDRLAP